MKDLPDLPDTDAELARLTDRLRGIRVPPTDNKGFSFGRIAAAKAKARAAAERETR